MKEVGSRQNSVVRRQNAEGSRHSKRVLWFGRILLNLFLLPTAYCLLPTGVHAQKPPGPSSPLYGARPGSETSVNGLPKALNEVKIEQKLNEQLPLDLTFRNEQGETVRLGDYFGKKPVVLSLVYYQCPMLCNQVLNGMVTSFKVLNFKPGEEFEVVTVSFDPLETAELARAKKSTYVNYLPVAKRGPAANGWHFLTGDQENIRRLTDAIGFHYYFDAATDQFAHSSAIYVATPQGKLSHYFYGIDYSPKDLRLSLVEASANKIGSPVDQLLLYCYHYDPATGKYGAVIINIVRLAGIGTLIAIGIMFVLMRRLTASRMRLHPGGTAS
jgi:protein SCO1